MKGTFHTSNFVSGIFLKFREGDSETSGDTSKSSQGRESESIASFEFCSPNEYLKLQKPKDAVDVCTNEVINEVEEDEKQLSLPEQLENMRLESEKDNPPELPSPQDKENIPPKKEQDSNFSENDKENVPPKDDGMESIRSKSRTAEPKCVLKQSRESSVDLGNESVLPDDLQKAVEMLNILVATRQIDNTMKKKLMRKVVQRLIKSKYSNESSSRDMSGTSRISSECSGQSSKKEHASLESTDRGGRTLSVISGVQALSPSNATNAGKEEAAPKTPTIQEKAGDLLEGGPVPSDINRSLVIPGDEKHGVTIEEDTMKDWLAPMTYSEIQFMNQKILTNKEIQKEIKDQQRKLQENLIKNQMIYANQEQLKANKGADENTAYNKNVRKFLEKEKKTHLNWIDQEIEHLKNLKELFSTNVGSLDNELTKLSLTGSKGCNIREAKDARTKSQNAIYENSPKNFDDFRQSARQIANVAGKQSISSSTDSSGLSKMFAKLSSSTLSNRLPSDCGQNSSDSFTRQTTGHENRSAQSDWNSHLNLQQIVKNRTKLQTPNTEESVHSYAKARRDQFMSKYTKTHGLLYSNGNVPHEEQPIYTKPYSTDHYSEPHRSHMKTLSKQTLNVDAYTSITGSNGFLSSNSISIAVPGNSTSNTTTHQYDAKASVGVQTTDTLNKTKPFSVKQKINGHPSTVRVSRLTTDKQQQATPQPLAYVITFMDQPSSNAQRADRGKKDRKYSEREADNHLYGDTNSSSTKSSALRLSSKSRRNTNAQKDMHFSSNDQSRGSSTTSSNSMASDEQLTLQEYLQRKRPDFYSNAEERRKCVNELHNLRYVLYLFINANL